MPAAVRIGPQAEDGSLGFDLGEVLRTVGDQSRLSWTMTGAYVLSPTPPSGDLWTINPADAVVTWSDLVDLSLVWLQVIDGTFIGRLGLGAPQLVITAVDSSYWVVWATDALVIARIRESFRHVESCAAPRTV
ncbi:MAG: hypothetical protein WCH40_04915 [Verrucomicrobiales bacterium]